MRLFIGTAMMLVGLVAGVNDWHLAAAMLVLGGMVVAQ